MVIPTSFELLYFNCYFTWVGFIDVRMLILTRVFCVLLYARVRLSDTTFETHLWSSELHLEIQLSIQIPAFPVDWFREVICCIGDFTAFELFGCILFLTLMYIVASWTTILYLFRCILLLCVCNLWLIYLLYMLRFAKFKLTIRYFELFKSDMYGFIVDLNGWK